MGAKEKAIDCLMKQKGDYCLADLQAIDIAIKETEKKWKKKLKEVFGDIENNTTKYMRFHFLISKIFWKKLKKKHLEGCE